MGQIRVPPFLLKNDDSQRAIACLRSVGWPRLQWPSVRRRHEGFRVMARATFAAGKFWVVEETFRTVRGVIGTTAGYMGGTVENPSAEDVAGGDTGHAEVVDVEYDPIKV